ncbi:hypothetical protein Clacol_000138 [Clathrus columnatus]|uniref:Uncharacterized protein n=1 Tax=Clathrus columnatus TaxID=1419009 RepID=A0AAV4ZYZ1_9AGAM|nr:hypothetical protein Clacol_000138 [Clathrus columnatus]
MGRNHDPEPEVVTANFTQILSRQASNNLNISLTINVTFPHSRVLEQETLSPKNNFTISSQEYLSCQITPTLSDLEKSELCNLIHRLQDYDTNDISSWNVSTSNSLKIAQKAFPSFDTHYRSFESQLFISVPVSHFGEIKNQTRTFDEDFYWVPTTVTEKENNRFFRSLNAQIPITISPNMNTNIPSTHYHYLSSHARHPLFVDQPTIYGLSQLSIEERDLLAPKSVPIIKRNTDNVVRRRYLQESMYYVGDTWHRKVLNGPEAPKLNSGRDGNLDALVIQVPNN